MKYKILSLALCIALLFSATTFSFASELEDTKKQIINKSDVSDELYEFLEELSIDIDSIISMEVQTLNATSRSSKDTSNVLGVKTVDDIGVKLYIISGLEENSSGDLVSAKIVEKNTNSRAFSNTWYPGNKNVVQITSAYVNIYQKGSDLTSLYHNPYSVQTFYYITSGSYSVQSIAAQYITKGEVYSYTSSGVGTYQGTTATHTISTSGNSPVQYQTYSKTSYYSSGPTKVLRVTNSGTLIATVYVSMKIDNKDYGATFTLY